MSTAFGTAQGPIIYPDSDGQPIAENTLQFRWIVTLQGGLDAVFAKDPNVFVAGDLLWYPVEGDPTTRQAPDVLVAFGRPKGYRGSYRQWEEGGIAPQVVFEVLSPGNRPGELARKFAFYEQYGVEEYYVYDPDRGELTGWLRPIADLQGWVSPRLKLRFEMHEGELRVYGPDGRPFATYVELVRQREEAQREREQAERKAEEARREREQAERKTEQAAQKVEEAVQTAEQAKQAAEQAKQAAEQAVRMAGQAAQKVQEAAQKAEQAVHRAEQAEQAAERLRAQLRALGVDPEA
jgi:Uma2 family endonuclease